MPITAKTMRKQLSMLKPFTDTCSLDMIRMGQNKIGTLMKFTNRGQTVIKEHSFGNFNACWILPKDETRQGWIYFDTVPRGESVATPYREGTITTLAGDAGLKSCKLPYHHPRGQTWFLFTKRDSRLPSPSQIALLHGLQAMPSLLPEE